MTWEHATITISRLSTCWCAASKEPEHMSNKNTDEDLTDLLCKRQFRKTDSVKICRLVCESQWSKSYNWVDVPAFLKILELGLVIWSQTAPISWRSWNVLWPSSTVKWLKMTAGHLGAILSDETMTGSNWIQTLDVDTCVIQGPYANKYAKHDTLESPTTAMGTASTPVLLWAKVEYQFRISLSRRAQKEAQTAVAEAWCSQTTWQL